MAKTIKWTKFTITEESKNYSSKVEFFKKNSGCYTTCMRNFPGLIDRLFINQIKPVGYWTKEKIIEEAKNYKTKSDMRVNSSSSYSIALKNYPWLLDELFAGKGKKRWTEDLIKDEAKKYSSKSDFSKNNPGAYSSALKRFPGLVDTLFVDNIIRYTREQIIEEAKKYKTKVEFKKGNVALYRSAWGRYSGLLDELFVNVNKEWDREKLVIEASKYDSKIEFLRNNSSAYSIIHKNFPGLINLLFENKYSYTKDDVIYCWHFKDDIYKIGVTSSHLADIRIKQVTKKLKCDALVLRLSFVEQASRLEKKLLNFGSPVKFEEKIDGSTEFRHLTADELSQVLAMIDAATIQQEQAA